MKKLICVIAAICLWHISFSQTVPLDSVKFYVGKTITVCSKVKSTYISKSDKPVTTLSFGEAYPNATFTAVIFSKDLSSFKYAPVDFLQEKEVCITGLVSIYKDKPQIVLSSEEQVKLK